MPKKKANIETTLTTISNLVYVILGLLLVVLAGLILLFFELG